MTRTPRKYLKAMASKGGKARALSLTPEERSRMASHAVTVRDAGKGICACGTCAPCRRRAYMRDWRRRRKGQEPRAMLPPAPLPVCARCAAVLDSRHDPGCIPYPFPEAV